MPNPIVSKAMVDGSGTDAEIDPVVASLVSVHPPFNVDAQNEVVALWREVTDMDSKINERDSK
jgi:hypothetical protein